MRYDWKVTPQEEGKTLLAFLKARLDDKTLSARKIKSLIDAGFCSINEKRERFANRPVVAKTCISLLIPDIEAKQTVTFSKERILFDDDAIFIYDKPANITCDEKGILSLFKKESLKLKLVHRLDKDTTGVLLCAKSEKAHQLLLEQFRKREVLKEYLAIVDGVLAQNHATIENYLAPLSRTPGQVRWGQVQKGGFYAETQWTCIKRAKNASLVGLFPQTGRTHQLRVHMSQIGHPIIGDRQYGKKFQCSYEALRQLLHAQKLLFCHPLIQKRLEVSAPLPQDMKDAIQNIFGIEWT